jgi:hypothetical protein
VTLTVEEPNPVEVGYPIITEVTPEGTTYAYAPGLK